MKNKYTTELNLEHNERPAKINTETGEISEIVKRSNNIPEGRQIFEPDAIFRKSYTASWKWLKNNTTKLELTAAIALSLMAKANTNSLEPINDETALKDLSEMLDVSINKINTVLKNLLKLGVYGKFEMYNKNREHTKYWILNPYLSFSGRTISDDVVSLFDDSEIAEALRNSVKITNV